MDSLRVKTSAPTLRTLPGDESRQILWRFADRFDLQMLVQSARSVARGPVARLVAEGARNSHEWTDRKAEMLKAFDEAGLSAVYLDPEDGGFIEGPKNLALALVAFELAWVDGGAATCSLATNLALAPIHERGTEAQRRRYMSLAAPGVKEGGRGPWRGAFCLTEPLPHVGVETGLLGGKVRIAEWPEGGEPLLEVDKRGRFITNMAFADFVTAAVESADDRIEGSCFVIVESGDPGTFDRGAPTRKMVHQLSSTRDPVLRVRVPASRIVGGHDIVDGVVVPRYGHTEILEAVFRRTRVTVGLMTAAKLLSAVEPVIRYQRGRFRGGDAAAPGAPRYELGLQMKEDALHRLVDVWATGEASASLGFAAARLFDELDPLEREVAGIFARDGLTGARSQMKAIDRVRRDALEYVDLTARGERGEGERRRSLASNPLVRFSVLDSLANVLCPATKLWSTGHGANMMREAVSLMGGYGITEDCPGFLGHKWMDAQLEATYEGPEAVQRRQLSITMTNPIFLAQLRAWIGQMRAVASRRPGTGACTLATAMELWLSTLTHALEAKDADGSRLYTGARQGVTFPLADALCWLLAARCQILDVLELEERGAANPGLADALPGLVRFLTDLCHVQAARAAGEAGRICAEIVFGYNRHPAWDETSRSACFTSEDLDEMEGVAPGLASGARSRLEVIETGEPNPLKAGPCVDTSGLAWFLRLRLKLEGCLTGSRLAKDRAAEDLTRAMIPEALGYPI